MLFRNLAIEALAYELPPRSVTSAEIEARLTSAMARLRLPFRSLEALTGVVERRMWDRGTPIHQVATRVARRAIDMAGIPPEAIGVLINTSVCKDYLEPSMASLIHGDLRLAPDCGNFDVANACLGFLNGIEIGGRMIESGQVDYALIVDGESSGEIVDRTIERLLQPTATAQDFWSNFATLTLGSGAVAMVLGHAKLSRTTHRVNGSVTLADTTMSRLCLGTAERMITESPRLLKAGVALAQRCWSIASQYMPTWLEATIDQYILHQVGKPHVIALCAALGIDVSKCFLSYPSFGNVGPAAVPLTLALAEQAGRVRGGNHVALMGIGSGLNVSMMSVSW
jgi:acyl-CoA:acyl-CoA alkyltransferase